MRDTYFLMWAYFFLLFCIIAFLVFPILFMILGLFLGFIGLAFSFGTSIGEYFITASSYPFQNWWLVLAVNALITTAIIVFTDYAKHTKTYQLLKRREKHKDF